MQESIQLVIDSLPFLLKGAGYTPEGSPENLVNHYHIGIPLL